MQTKLNVVGRITVQLVSSSNRMDMTKEEFLLVYAVKR